MKQAASLFLCLFVLAIFQLSFANNTPVKADSAQAHTFVTPEQTWEHFKAALLDGDFSSAKMCCCTGKTKTVYKFEKMTEEKRKGIVLSMQPLKKLSYQENSAKYQLIREVNGVPFSTYVYFEKENGSWKIASY